MSSNNEFTPEQLTQLNNMLDSRLDYNLSNITQAGKDMINSTYEATIKTRMDVNMSNVTTAGKTVVKNLVGDSDAVKNIILGECLSPYNYLRNETLNSKTLIIQPYTYLVYKPDNSIYFTNTKVSINVVSCLDTGSSLSVGTDYCVYLVKDSSGEFAFKVSKNKIAPSGYTESTSTKIGGFHTECVSVGTISGHPLSGLTAGSILPASVWTTRHRPVCDPSGMVYVARIGKWVDIYLQSGTGTSTASAYNATHTVSRKWDLHADDMSMVGKGFLTDNEFGMAAEGSNCATNIKGTADATTVGGHSDTADRRMVSNDGLEEMCGYLWQWLACPSANGGSGWSTTTGGKGECYGSSYALLAGGSWDDSSYCGPWSRVGLAGRGHVSADFGGRGCAPGFVGPSSFSD